MRGLSSEKLLTEKEPLRIVYRKYLRTRQRITMLEGQLRDYNNPGLFLPPGIFRPHTGPSGALEELNMLRTILSADRGPVYFP